MPIRLKYLYSTFPVLCTIPLDVSRFNFLEFVIKFLLALKVVQETFYMILFKSVAFAFFINSFKA